MRTQVRKNLYLCENLRTMATTQTKKINWLFPDPDVEVTEEDILAEIRRAERSGSMTLEEYNEKFSAWRKENMKSNLDL